MPHRTPICGLPAAAKRLRKPQLTINERVLSSLFITCASWLLCLFLTCFGSADNKDRVVPKSCQRHGFEAISFPFHSIFTPAVASMGFENCTEEHLINGVHPSLLSPDTVSVPMCKGGAYVLNYDKPMLNPQYSTWSITKRKVEANIPGRESSFRQDPDLRALKIPQANASSTVWSTLWNRGHLAPSRMLSSTEWSKYNTYFYSNVAPQWWNFNQQEWEQTEEALFNFVGDPSSYASSAPLSPPIGIDEPFYVVTGVDYADREAGVNRTSSVAMPDFFYTAVCLPSRQRSVAFVGVNVENTEGGTAHLFTLRSVRELEMMISSTSGTIFDDFLSASSSPSFSSTLKFESLCNTTQIDSSFWSLSKFDRVSEWPSSTASALSQRRAQGAANVKKMKRKRLQREAENKEEGKQKMASSLFSASATATTSAAIAASKYHDNIAIDVFRLEFRGTDWEALILPQQTATSSSCVKNNGNNSAVRDCVVASFRAAMRKGHSALPRTSTSNSNSQQQQLHALAVKKNKKTAGAAHNINAKNHNDQGDGAMRLFSEHGLLQWPAHGYILEMLTVYAAAPVMTAAPLETPPKTQRRRLLFKSSGLHSNENDGDSLKMGTAKVGEALSSSSSSSLEPVGLVVDVRVHRLRSLTLPADNTVSVNVTAAIAAALRGTSFSALLAFYLAEVEAATGKVPVDPSAFGGYFPLRVAIVGSDVRSLDPNGGGGGGGAGDDDDLISTTAPKTSSAPPRPPNSAASAGRGQQSIAAFLGVVFVFIATCCFEF